MKLINLIQPDYKALQFYSDYLLADHESLPSMAQKNYRANAEVLNAINQYIIQLKGHRHSRSGNVKIDWQKIATATNNLSRNKFPHSLPSHHRRLNKKFKSYMNNGYAELVSQVQHALNQ